MFKPMGRTGGNLEACSTRDVPAVDSWKTGCPYATGFHGILPFPRSLG